MTGLGKKCKIKSCSSYFQCHNKDAESGLGRIKQPPIEVPWPY